MDIRIAIERNDLEYGSSRLASVLRKIADAVDENPADVTIRTVEGKEQLARDNCAIDENVASVQVEAEKALTERQTVNQNLVSETLEGRTTLTTEQMDKAREEAAALAAGKAPTKRKRRTKKEMEAARAAEAAAQSGGVATAEVIATPEDVEKYLAQQDTDGATDPIDAALDALDQEEAPPPAPVDVDDPAAALRQMMVKLVKKFGPEGPQMMSATVQRIAGETDITKVPEERFAAVYAALNQILAAGEPEAETEPGGDGGIDY